MSNYGAERRLWQLNRYDERKSPFGLMTSNVFCTKSMPGVGTYIQTYNVVCDVSVLFFT